MMNWIKKQMSGRYGYDQLSMALLALSLLLTFIGSLSNVEFLLYLGYVPLILSLFRIFSRNFTDRRLENYKFMQMVSAVHTFWNKKKQQLKNRRHYRYFRCTGCKQQLRVPRGRGKIVVTCPKCRTEMTKKT